MSTLHVADPVSVWLEEGRPVRLVWRGRRYRVTDTPTPIRETTGDLGPTHPTDRLVGWRFQGTAETGESHIFDVRGLASGNWHLTAWYD